MSNFTLFIMDESGDLGWAFEKPYRAGGSSRYLSIATLIVPSQKKHFPKRIIREMSNHFAWQAQVERKASEFTPAECIYFADKLSKLIGKHADISIKALTVNKQKVEPHIRADSNKLYNYMTKLLLGDDLALCQSAMIMPDERSIKVRSGNSLLDYLKVDQWFEKKTRVKIDFLPQTSSANLNVRVADAIAHIVFAHYEDDEDNGYSLLQAVGDVNRTLFF